jgi:hypothetical protein
MGDYSGLYQSILLSPETLVIRIRKEASARFTQVFQEDINQEIVQGI